MGSENMIKNFLREERGLELSEYAVAAALVAVAVVAAFTALGTAIGSRLNTLAATVNG
jgi:pilus assembly protein Flp/PilA